MAHRILILKLGALGDVLRTTPLLSALRQTFADGHVTWVTEAASIPLLEGNPNIQRVLTMDYASLLPLEVEEFDLLLSLDKDPAAATLAMKVKAKVKRGFGWSAGGELTKLDEKSDYAYRLGIDNELKFRTNDKTYQQITFEMCDIPYLNEEYQWEIGLEDLEYSKLWAKGTGLDLRRPTIGLNTGWGEKFAGKGWFEDHWHRAIDKLQNLDANLILLGGPREVELNDNLFRTHRGRGSLHHAGTENTIGQFGGLVGLCDLVLTGDTFGMHVAIARKKKVLVLFGSTCRQEIELYGRGAKLYPTDLPCSPCYKKLCDQPVKEDCLRRISPDQVLQSIQELLPLKPLERQPAPVRSQGNKDSEEIDREQSREQAPTGENPRDSRERQWSQGPRRPRRRGRDQRWRRGRQRSQDPSPSAPSSPNPS